MSILSAITPPLGHGAQVGPYEVVGHLATGGMGEVYLARKRGIGGFERTVVLKVMLPHLAQDERFANMFVDEARIASGLSHPNIVQVYDLGTSDEGGLYLAMEHLQGVSAIACLKRCAQDEQWIPEEVAARAVCDAATALAYAHAATGEDGAPLELVHRDVSPENVFLTYAGPTKILDFGVAKVRDRLAETQAGEFKGKVGYMAPEIIRGQAPDARADLFSLGVVLFELLTNRRLFHAPVPATALHRVLSAPVPDIRSLREGVADPLAELVARMLERNLKRRIGSAEEVVEALETWLTGRPGTQRHVSRWLQEVFADAHALSARIAKAVERTGAINPDQLREARRLNGEALEDTLVRELSDSERHPFPTRAPPITRPVETVTAALTLEPDDASETEDAFAEVSDTEVLGPSSPLEDGLEAKADLERPGSTFWVPPDPADHLTAHGRADHLTARGRADHLTARGRADHLTAPKRADHLTAPKRADHLTAPKRAGQVRDEPEIGAPAGPEAFEADDSWIKRDSRSRGLWTVLLIGFVVGAVYWIGERSRAPAERAWAGRYARVELLHEDDRQRVFTATPRSGQGPVLVVAEPPTVSIAAALASLDEARERLERIEDPGLPPPVDVGVHEARPFSVYRLERGRTLAETLRDERVGRRRGQRLVRAIAEVMAVAEEGRLIHGWLSAELVWLTKNDQVRILGFRGPRASDRFMTKGPPRGDPGLAPELATGAPAGPAADQYALARLLSNILRETDQRAAVAAAAVFARATAVEPSARYASTQAFVRDLERALRRFRRRR